MKRLAVRLAAVFTLVLYSFTPGYCEIWWLNDFQQFRFAVERNGGLFQYAPLAYLRSTSDTDAVQYNPTQGIFGDYDEVATGDFVEFTTVPGDIRMQAMARGPTGGINPAGGILVQGSLETIPAGLGLDHALDVEQKVVTFVSRRFETDSDQTYTLFADLSGLIDYDEFYANDRNQTQYSVSGTVSLEQIVEAEDLIEMVPGFPVDLNPANPSIDADVALITENDEGDAVTYQLTVRLVLTSRIVNFLPEPYNVYRVISGTYKLGTMDFPLKLIAVLNSRRTAMPWIPLLLLDDSGS